MFGLCKEATEVALMIIVLVIFIGFFYLIEIDDGIMTIIMVLVIAFIVSISVAATNCIQRDHNINIAIESSLDKNYIGYTNLNTKKKTFIFNDKQFSYEFDYDKKQLTVFKPGQVVDGVYIDGVQTDKNAENTKQNNGNSNSNNQNNSNSNIDDKFINAIKAKLNEKYPDCTIIMYNSNNTGAFKWNDNYYNFDLKDDLLEIVNTKNNEDITYYKLNITDN